MFTYRMHTPFPAHTQDQLAAIPDVLVASEYMSNVPPFISWYNVWLNWLSAEGKSNLDAQGRPTSRSDFMTWLKEWIGTEEGAAFENNVVFSRDGSEIISSKVSGKGDGRSLSSLT